MIIRFIYHETTILSPARERASCQLNFSFTTLHHAAPSHRGTSIDSRITWGGGDVQNRRIFSLDRI